ncbi:MAG: hypothetical protein KDC95_12485 [Planctomycetes bacterium]|nr:hypothetical protein [Planctomycetota bacterium]
MNWKKLLKVLAITIFATIVLVVAAFATFVYNPFEGNYGELRRAVPYGVDFFAAKPDLAKDFDDFPVPLFWQDFETSPAFPKIRIGTIYKGLQPDVAKALEEVRNIDAQLRAVPVLGLSILGDAIGKDLAIAGKMKADRSSFDVCAYTLVSWKVRAGIEMLGFDFVRSRLQGLTVNEEDGIYELRGNQAPFWLTRVKDLVIAGTSKDLVVESRALATNESSGDSIWTSADYNDLLASSLDNVTGTGGIVELMADLATLRDYAPAFATWPGTGIDVTQEQKLIRAFLSPKAMRRMWSSLEFDTSVAKLKSSLLLDPGELDDFQRRFQDANPGDKTWLQSFLRLAPYTAAFVATMRVPPGEFFRTAFRTLEQDAQNLIDDGIRRSGRSTGIDGMIDQVAPALEPWVGVIFRNNDYPRYKKEFEVGIPSPAPVWALVMRAENGAGKNVEDLITLFREQLRFSLKFDGQDFIIPVGPNKEQKIQEWGNRMMPGTGQIAVLYDDKSRDFIVSNSGKLVREMINSQFSSNGMRSILKNDEVLKRTVAGLPQGVSGFAWLSGARALNVVQGYQEFTSKRLQQQAADPGFLLAERGGVEKMILSRDFPGRRDSTRLSPSEMERFDKLVDAELARRWQTERSRLGRDSERQFREAAAWLEALGSAALVVRTHSKQLDFELQLTVPW